MLSLSAWGLTLALMCLGFQLPVEVHVQAHAVCFVLLMPTANRRCQLEVTRAGAPEFFMQTAAAVGRAVHSRKLVSPLFLVRSGGRGEAREVRGRPPSVGATQKNVAPSSPGAQGATSLPPPPPGPASPTAACVSLVWFQTALLGIVLPTLLCAYLQACSRRRFLKALMQGGSQELRQLAQCERAMLGLAATPSTNFHNPAEPLAAPHGRWHERSVAGASALASHAACGLLAWQGASAAWAACCWLASATA